jgi:hypothetical protein
MKREEIPREVVEKLNTIHAVVLGK